ncbi:MAG: ABC transporter permease [Candidatus Sumerlaeia bacterium]
MAYVYQNPNLLEPEYVQEDSSMDWRSGSKIYTLLKYMTQRHLANRYRGSFLGFFWSLLNPIMMMFVYSFAFKFVIRAEVPGIPFSCFFLSAFLAWNCFNTGAANAGAAVADGGFLIRKAYFPRYALPLSAVLSNLINYLIAMPLLLIFNAIMGIYPGVNLLLLPLAIAYLMCLTIGVGFLIAAIAPFFRDLLELIQVLFTAWFFLTPVIYPMSLLSSHMTPLMMKLYMLNPMVGCIRLIQSIFLGMPFPRTELLYSLPGTCILLMSGLLLFRRVSPRFSNVVQ